MKLINLTIGALLTVSLISCNNEPREEGYRLEEAVHETPHLHSSDDAIELDNGAKWLVNEEMKPHISEAEELLNTYITSGATDFQALAGTLKEKNTDLVRSCTMKGKSHDELHKWLHPHMELIDRLSKAENQDDGDRLVSEIKTSFQTYHAHFR